MYKEYREMSRTEAVEALYQDMAARHRARFRSIHVGLLNPPRENDSANNAVLRFSRSSKLRKPQILGDHTSSSSLPRTSNSPFLIALPRPRARTSFLLDDLRLLLELVISWQDLRLDGLRDWRMLRPRPSSLQSPQRCGFINSRVRREYEYL